VPEVAPRVAQARVLQGGIVQHVELIGAAREGLEAGLDQDRRPDRIGDVGLGDPVASGPGVDLPVGEGPRVGDFHLVGGVIPFQVHERPAVRDDELEVLDVGHVHLGVVDLGQDALAEGEPDLRVRGGGRAQAILGTGGPGRGATRCPRGVGGRDSRGSHLPEKCPRHDQGNGVQHANSQPR
jgi:hypothetical protein